MSFLKSTSNGVHVPSASSPDAFDDYVVQAPTVGALFTDSFENGLLHTDNGIKWGGSDRGSENASVSSDIARTGGSSLKLSFPAVSLGVGSRAQQDFTLGSNMQVIHLEYYMYFPDGTEGLGAAYVHRDDGGSVNNKFIRLWNDIYTSYDVKMGCSLERGSISKFWPEYAVDTGGMSKNGYLEGSIQITSSDLGKWTKINQIYRVDTGSGMAIKIWKNDVLTVNNVMTADSTPADSSQNFLKYGYLMGTANSGFAAQTNIYIDDFVISDSAIGGKTL